MVKCNTEQDMLTNVFFVSSPPEGILEFSTIFYAFRSYTNFKLK